MPVRPSMRRGARRALSWPRLTPAPALRRPSSAATNSLLPPWGCGRPDQASLLRGGVNAVVLLTVPFSTERGLWPARQILGLGMEALHALAVVDLGGEDVAMRVDGEIVHPVELAGI